MNIQSLLMKTLAATLLASTLSGCVAALAGGAALGANSALDRRSTGAQTDDNVMELRIHQNASTYLKQKTYPFDISVVSYNRHILLLGYVGTEADKHFVEQIARSEQAAAQVYNHIEVSTPNQTLGNVVADTWNTTKVRTTLLGVQNTYPGRVKIVTYADVTYVFGILTPAEQAAVTEKVSTTAGVKKVVTFYQNYTPSK